MNIKQLRKVLAVEENHFLAEGDLETAAAIAIFANLLEGRDSGDPADTIYRGAGRTTCSRTIGCRYR